MTEEQMIAQIAKDLCTLGGDCSSCNASIGFECTAKVCAKKLYALGYSRRPEGQWVPENYPTAVARTRFGKETFIYDHCSVCGNKSRDLGNYCSHCGARMRTPI